MESVDRPLVDICLIVPPFGTVHSPSFGVSVLASSCRERSLNIKVIYANIILAGKIGYDLYNEIFNSRLRQMLCERSFIPHVYSRDDINIISTPDQLSHKEIALVKMVSDQLDAYISECVGVLMMLRPKIVGLSSSFQQNLAAVAFAKAIRKADSSVCIVSGGANMTSPMGEALMDTFSCFDYVFSGEADTEFPDFCESYLNNKVERKDRLIECQPVSDMTQAKIPDFSDYYETLGELQKSGKLPPGLPHYLPMETARGCWWGEKHPCVFCGLNARGIRYREKSSNQVLSEMQYLITKWKPCRIHLVDNILSKNCFSDLLPKLEILSEKPKIFCEVKVNINEEQLDQMVGAGIDAIQPGIESLASSILKLMKKGNTAIQNIILLRNCKSRGIRVLWNFLCKIPGESVNAYNEILKLIPKIEHLNPPDGLREIIVARYSQYFDASEKFGIERITPWKSYFDLYPKSSRLNDIAFHFDGEYRTELMDDHGLLRQLDKALNYWKETWFDEKKLPSLRVIEPSANKFCIVDTRSGAEAKLYKIDSSMVKALNYFSHPRRLNQDLEFFHDEINFLVNHNLVIEYEGVLLSVVT